MTTTRDAANSPAGCLEPDNGINARASKLPEPVKFPHRTTSADSPRTLFAPAAQPCAAASSKRDFGMALEPTCDLEHPVKMRGVTATVAYTTLATENLITSSTSPLCFSRYHESSRLPV